MANKSVFAAVLILGALCVFVTQTVGLVNQALANSIKKLNSPNVATSYFLAKNPTVLTSCAQQLHQASDSQQDTFYINGCISKAVTGATPDTRVVQVLKKFAAQATAVKEDQQTPLRLTRVAAIIECAIKKA